LSKFVKLQHPLVNTIRTRFGSDKVALKLKEFGSFSIEKNKYGYFRFESFQFSIGLNYDEFLKKSFASMKKKKIDQLIIDLRGNTGGIIQVEFLRYLLPEGTKIGSYEFEKQSTKSELRKMGFKTHSWSTKVYLKNLKALKRADKLNMAPNGPLKVGQNYPEKFKGQIVVITDEGTFSAASILACQLKTLAKAKIVGTRAGGSFYAGNAGSLELVLRKSKLTIQLNPNFFSTQLYPAATIDSDIKNPDLETFSETEIPSIKFETNPKKVKPSEDPVIKQAEKLLK
jgi:C-terminal processing protease CtpA/Prc